MIQISPSILAADFSCLSHEVKRTAEAGADSIHIDVMDGHFVPSITIGAMVTASLRDKVDIPFDVHLQVTAPERHIAAFAEAGAGICTFQVETASNMYQIIENIKKLGMKAGVALAPGTSLAFIEEVLPTVDRVLLLSVNPGYGGQKFLPFVLAKIRMLRSLLTAQSLATEIEVDGGIDFVTARQAIQAGATILAVGTTVYEAPDMKEAIQKLKRAQDLQ